MSTITPLLHQAILDTREEEYSGKKKTTFWASESELMAFDIYHRWMGTEPTHPMSEEKMLMLKMRKLTEEAVVHYMRKSGKLIEKFTNDDRVFFEWGKHKTPISGYADLGLLIENEEILVEVKTYYGGKNHSEIRVGKVKTAYLKQLAIYMYHYKIKHGILMMINQGTGEVFEFELYAKSEYHFICPDNEIEFDLKETFLRFEKIWTENIQKKVEPAIEFIYKYDIDKIDWEDTSADAIRKARGNHAVIGDWQCKWSDFKGMIAERQKTSLGYTDEELARIRELTAGYSSRSSSKVKFDPKDL